MFASVFSMCAASLSQSKEEQHENAEPSADRTNCTQSPATRSPQNTRRFCHSLSTHQQTRHVRDSCPWGLSEQPGARRKSSFESSVLPFSDDCRRPGFHEPVRNRIGQRLPRREHGPVMKTSGIGPTSAMSVESIVSKSLPTATGGVTTERKARDTCQQGRGQKAANTAQGSPGAALRTRAEFCGMHTVDRRDDD